MAKQAFGQESCWTDRGDAKACERHRMSRQMQHRLQKFVSQFFPIASQRLHEPAIPLGIAGKSVGCKIDISMQACCGAIIQWMRQRDVRLNPLQSESFQRKCFEKRRASRERMDRRTNVVQKSRQC